MSTYTSEPGTRLGGRYRLEDRLAAAGGWSAWKAIDEILARPVSVITFAAGFPRLQEVVTAARAASRLSDTRLTQVFDVEDDWEHAYIVLEWPVGETLADLLAAETLDPLVGARIVAEAAAAVATAHAAGLAHLCVQPEAVRWTATGGVKVTGLGIDAALAGITADDPALADTIGLGSLLYATLTGTWPGPERPDLPPAPMTDGRPRRPRQVRAGVPKALDEITSRALGLGGSDDQPFAAPGELADKLATAVPRAPIPPPLHVPRDQHPDSRHGPASLTWQADRSAFELQPGGPRRSTGRVAAVTLLALAAIVGLSAAALHFLHGRSSGHPGNSPSVSRSQHTAQGAAVLTPSAAYGFDAYHGQAQDPGDENNAMAVNLITHNKQGWSTAQYYNYPRFGNLKPGSGLILDMGRSVRISSVTITFGSEPGADVQLKVGDSAVRSVANEKSMVTVAARNNVSGTQLFTIGQPVADRYLVVWFTKLPPMAGASNKYQAQVLNIIIRGTG
jgi:hypothetical protein